LARVASADYAASGTPIACTRSPEGHGNLQSDLWPGLSQHHPSLDRKGLRSMLFALLYLVARRLFGLAGGSGSEDLSKDVEILVLRHQPKVWGKETRSRAVSGVVVSIWRRLFPDQMPDVLKRRSGPGSRPPGRPRRSRDHLASISSALSAPPIGARWCLGLWRSRCLWGAIIRFRAPDLQVRDSTLWAAWPTGMPRSGRLPGPPRVVGCDYSVPALTCRFIFHRSAGLAGRVCRRLDDCRAPAAASQNDPRVGSAQPSLTGRAVPAPLKTGAGSERQGSPAWSVQRPLST